MKNTYKNSIIKLNILLVFATGAVRRGIMARLLCFIGEISLDFQSELTQELSKVAAKNGHEVVFCVNFDTTSVNPMYGIIEKKIIYLPDLKSFDGIVFCHDTYAIHDMEYELSDYVHTHCDVPAISLRVIDDNCYTIMFNDHPAMCKMVEHFIVDHKFTRICFMTGRMELDDAHRRLDAYRDTMAKYGIEITDGMVFYGDYWRDRGDEALDYFLKNNDEMPQAIVCSNDYMALSICNALNNRNLVVGKDICVSGLDDIDEARYHLPPLTTLRGSTQSLSKAVIDTFDDIWNGKEPKKHIYLPLDPVIRNSCGCVAEIDYTSFNNLYQNKEEILAALHFSPYLTLDFDAADSFADLVYSIHLMLVNKSYGSPEDFGTIYFCLCDEKERQDNMVEMASNFTNNMILSAIITRGDVKLCNEVFERKEILPEKYMEEKGQTYIFSLHCKDVCYGYIVLKIKDITKINHLIKALMFSVGNALDRIRMFSENKTIQQLKEQSYVDELTKISNRRFMEHFIHRLYERLQRTGEAFCVMSIDLDGLKYINDNYGHLEGDNAIISIAKILDEIKPQHGMAARTGGDEFMLLFPSGKEKEAERYVERIYYLIRKYNKNSDKPYELSASIGFEFCREGMDLLVCMHEADKKMYAIKSAKKNSRKD